MLTRQPVRLGHETINPVLVTIVYFSSYAIIFVQPTSTSARAMAQKGDSMLVIQLKNILDATSRVVITRTMLRDPEYGKRKIEYEGPAASIPELLTQRRVEGLAPVLKGNVCVLHIDLGC